MTDSPSDPASIPATLAAFLRDELGAQEDAGAPCTVIASGSVRIWVGGESSASWYFLPVTGEAAIAIRNASAGRTGGWGSVKVEVHLGTMRWTTSLFPSKETGGYLLPLKAAVRKAETIEAGDAVRVELMLL